MPLLGLKVLTSPHDMGPKSMVLNGPPESGELVRPNPVTRVSDMSGGRADTDTDSLGTSVSAHRVHKGNTPGRGGFPAGGWGWEPCAYAPDPTHTPAPAQVI